MESSATAIELEISLPAAGVRQVVAEGKNYDLLEIEGLDLTSDEGKPRLPFVSALVAVPPGADVGLEVVDAPADVLPGSFRILPQAALDVEVPLVEPSTGGAAGSLPRSTGVRIVEDEAVYGGEAWFPAQPVVLGEPALLRSQRVVSLRFYPVQFNPATGEVRQARHARIRLLLSYEDGAARSAQPLASAETPAFEPLLRSAVVNYEAATSWRAAPQPVDLARSVAAWVPPVPGWRLAVDRDGIYELTYPALASAGVAVDLLDPRTFQVFTGGEEVAIRVVGEEDGTFDAQDVILFWGEGPDDKYTNRNVYWLGYGQAMGLRMATRPAGTTAGVPVPPATWARPHFEENVGYWSLMPGDDALERFYWAYASAGESMVRTFSLESVASVPGNATLLVGLVGYTSFAAMAPDHHVEMYVNGNLVGGAAWDSVSYHTAALPFPQDYLRSGDNEIRFRVPGDTGAPSELNLLDWFEVHYQREYQASDDMLRFGGDNTGQWAYHVTNFSSAEVELFDVTETERPEIILGASVAPAGSRYTLAFGDSSAAPRQYWAQSTARRLSPLSIVPDTPSDLHDPGNGADYLVIAHHDFLAALSPLLDARAAQGYRVAAVDVQDVYDEFAGGRLSPEAIRSFLAYAYHNWTPPAPSYVLLVGDAHFDPRDHMGYGLGIFVPAYLGVVDPWLGETATDNWYACIEGDDNLPDLHIGRVPANTAAEAAAAVAKIVAYESLEPAAWMSNAVFVTDNPDDAGDFYAYSDAVIAGYLPSTYTPSSLYLGSTCATGVACRSQLVAAINSGQLLVNYIGHGSVSSWAGESIFRAVDVATLANGNRLPLFVPMTCLEGSYHYPFPDSTALGEAVVVTAGKGGVSSWSPTGFGVSQGHDYLNKGLFEAFFDTGLRQLGPATYAAKLRLVAAGTNLDQLDTYHILGDPALHVNALDADVALTKTAEYQGTLAPGDLLTYTLAFANAGPGTAHNVVLTDVLPIELVDPVVVYASPEVLAPRPGVTLAWDIAPLLPGASGEIQIRGRVDPAAAPGFRLSNAAEIRSSTPDTDPGNNAALIYSGVGLPNLTVAKQGPSTVVYGQVVDYTISWANEGPVNAVSVRLTDTLPAGVTYLADDSGWALSTPMPGTIVWQVGQVDAGVSGSFRLTVSLPASEAVASPVINRVAIGATVADADPTDNQASWTSELLLPDLHVGVTGTPSATYGQQASYTITWGNRGAVAATNVRLTDVLPPGLLYVDDDGPGASTEPAPGTRVWNLGTLAPGASGSLILTAELPLDPALPVSLDNRVSIDGDLLDANPADDEATWSTELLLPDLGAAKVGPALAATDSTVRYTIHYLNSGLGLAFGALLSDELPYGLEYDSDDSGLPHSQPQPGVHVWTLDNVPAGARGQFELVVRVTRQVIGSVAINKVRITSPVPDALPASNEGQWSMLVPSYRVYLPLVRRAAPVP
ncbi:MAG: DUF11 domain-containing protein [Anaerolineaceae bacterium]|nr:DUF11 domain-containing protein [Anaerolineaceae bacterium]